MVEVMDDKRYTIIEEDGEVVKFHDGHINQMYSVEGEDADEIPGSLASHLKFHPFAEVREEDDPPVKLVPTTRAHMIDTSFDMSSDANGGDPDLTSPTLRRYHKLLWSKSLPSGNLFDLREDTPGYYLHHSSTLGDFSLGSDAITHSYKNQKSKKWLTMRIPKEVQALFDRGSTIGAYIVFPNRMVNGKQTINQARGVLRLIDDRFDLTLECIRRLYADETSPLEEVLNRYSPFFRLFDTFEGYAQFFLLHDLIDEQGRIKFYSPFDDFQSPPQFRDVDDYMVYKSRVESFINARSRRIEAYAKQLT